VQNENANDFVRDHKSDGLIFYIDMLKGSLDGNADGGGIHKIGLHGGRLYRAGGNWHNGEIGKSKSSALPVSDGNVIRGNLAGHQRMRHGVKQTRDSTH
jgi:hypothetical protein